MSPDTFHFYHRPIRDYILSKPTIAIIVCVASNDPGLIIGWILVETLHGTDQLIVHYVYVKQMFKGENIASELLAKGVPNDLPIFISHMTDKAWRILSKKNNRDDFYYAPHLI